MEQPSPRRLELFDHPEEKENLKEASRGHHGIPRGNLDARGRGDV